MTKAAIIGAGKTGRGFLARLLAESGAAIRFIDKDAELISRLNEEKEYKIGFFGDVRKDMKISGYEAVTWENANVEDCDFILVSVGGSNLEEVGESLSRILTEGKSYTIITCENSSKPAQKLKEKIGREDISVSESTVFCTTTDDGLDIMSENYPYLQCNADLLPGFESPVAGIKPVSGFGDFLTRKLYTYNAASCVIAYLGYVKGYEDYAEAANDPEILKLLDENYEVTNRTLCKEFGYDEKDQAEFALLSRDKFTSRAIKDTVERNGRDPLRKLAAGERIIGPMRLIYSHGEDASVLIKTAASALLFDGKGEEKWREAKEKLGIDGIMQQVMGLSPDEELFEKIKKEYLAISKK